mmetsp:Transcript_3368/g.10268  ORF Transcript_3368/g.10268 Transcript_3368/m.10268 type:complete len:283 (-) Transcript_3368:164-1012(-)
MEPALVARRSPPMVRRLLWAGTATCLMPRQQLRSTLQVPLARPRMRGPVRLGTQTWAPTRPRPAPREPKRMPPGALGAAPITSRRQRLPLSLGHPTRPTGRPPRLPRLCHRPQLRRPCLRHRQEPLSWTTIMKHRTSSKRATPCVSLLAATLARPASSTALTVSMPFSRLTARSSLCHEMTLPRHDDDRVLCFLVPLRLCPPIAQLLSFSSAPVAALTNSKPYASANARAETRRVLVLFEGRVCSSRLQPQICEDDFSSDVYNLEHPIPTCKLDLCIGRFVS